MCWQKSADVTMGDVLEIGAHWAIIAIDPDAVDETRWVGRWALYESSAWPCMRVIQGTGALPFLAGPLPTQQKKRPEGRPSTTPAEAKLS
jgi:hypothetical protein